MTRAMSAAYEYGDRPWALDAVRRLEAYALIAVSILLVIQYAPIGAVPAFALLGAALLLLPAERSAALTREQARSRLLNELQSQALELRSRYMEIHGRALNHSRAEAMWRVRREIIVWLARSEKQLTRYPEFAGIYKACLQHGGMIDELDRALGCLSELKRLTTLSQKLKLPI